MALWAASYALTGRKNKGYLLIAHLDGVKMQRR